MPVQPKNQKKHLAQQQQASERREAKPEGTNKDKKTGNAVTMHEVCRALLMPMSPPATQLPDRKPPMEWNRRASPTPSATAPRWLAATIPVSLRIRGAKRQQDRFRITRKQEPTQRLGTGRRDRHAL
jgi:hypothetical protein